MPKIFVFLLLSLAATHLSFSQEPSTAIQKNTGVASFVPKRPFNEKTYNDFACMITSTLYDDARALVKSLGLSLTESNQYQVVLGDVYDSTQGKNFVVNKQVIVFGKEVPDVDDKVLFILEPNGKSLQITVATTLHKGDQLLCIKSFVTINLAPKSKL